MHLVLALLILLAPLPCFAQAGWLPSQVTKVDFTPEELDSLTQEFHKAYDPDFAPPGGKFEIKFFKSIFSNLSMATMKGEVHHVAIMAGNLPKNSMDMDSLRLLICHEVGHFMGGGPRRIELDPNEDQLWNVIEGASDYFATTQCMKRILKGQDHVEVLLRQPGSDEVLRLCAESFSSSEDRMICARSLNASKKLIAFFANVKKVENIYRFDTPDMTTVETTSAKHPDLQCRLDTYKAGALCNVDASEVMDPKDLSKGTCSDRPACWFQSAK